MSADPAQDHLPMAQATFGIKGLGALFATIEIAELGKPVQALHCELYADKAPLAVANFVGLARGLRPWKDPKLGQWVRRPLYDGNLLHRVIPELLLQGGDPNCSVDVGCRGAAGVGDPGYSIVDEFRPELRFDRGGRLAMANHGPGTSGSQFFITEREATWLNGSHTIFGQCDGAELITQLSHVETGSRDQPKAPLTIKRVTFIRKPK
jgi:peptidyl-prolyl cis-trans isomerase A (cyclophilin A)